MSRLALGNPRCRSGRVIRCLLAINARGRWRGNREARSRRHERQVAGTTVEDLELYHEAARAGELQVRVYAAVFTPGTLDGSALDRLEELRQKYGDSPLFKTGALKFRVDGVIEAHTAAMLEPYANRPDSGETTVAPDDFNRSVRLADARGWQL